MTVLLRECVSESESERERAYLSEFMNGSTCELIYIYICVSEKIV